MKLLPQQADRVRTSVSSLAGVALALTLIAGARAQAPTESTAAESKATPKIVATIHLTHVTAQRDFSDLQTDLRNLLPMTVIYGIQTQNAISLRGTPEEIETAKKVIADLDRPRKSYRVTYTFTDMDNGKPSNVRHLTLIALAGEKAVAKHGNRVPIVTGMFENDSPAQSSQVQYLDIGLNVEATLDGDRLRSKVEQTGLADERSGIGVQDPIVRQTMMEAVSDVKPGKSMLLGSIDVPGTSRQQNVEAVAELIQ